MANDYKNFTISNAKNADIDRFKSYIDGTPDKKTFQAFTRILDLAAGQTAPPDELYQKYHAALEKIDQLQAALDAESDKVVIAQRWADDLNKKLTLSEAKPQPTEVKPETPSGNAFIFTPSDDQFKQMHRAILYLIKQGKANRTDKNLPQSFTSKAITYLIKNEFSHILK